MKKLLGILCLLFALVLAGCSNGSGSTKETSVSKDGKKIVKIAWQDSGFISPFTFTTSGPGGYLRNSFLFDTLTWKDEKGVIPWLATDWTVSDDQLTYTFKLEDNVKFHDGKPLTADDVVFSYTYFKKHVFPWNADMTKIKSAEKVSDTEVKIHLNEPFSPFITEIAGILPIIPKHIWEDVKNPVDYQEDKALVGSGPFVLKDYDKAAGNYRFVKNDKYFKGKVNVDEVHYLAVENNILSLQNNEISAGMTFNYKEVEQMKRQGFDVIKADPTGSAVRVLFNLDHPQLNDKRLRQAIAYALNRAQMSEKLTGSDQPMVGNAGVVPLDSPWYNKDVKQYDYSKEKANALLDELGYSKNKKGIRDGLKLRVLVSSTSQEAELMKVMLAKVGIDLTIQTVDAAAFSTAMSEGKYDMAITGHIGLSGDPDFLRLWFSGQASNAYAGKSVFNNKEFKKLADLQLTQTDEADRKETIGQMQDILAEELPTLVLYHRPFYFIYKASDFDGWFNTYGGISDGIPLWDNKAAFID